MWIPRPVLGEGFPSEWREASAVLSCYVGFSCISLCYLSEQQVSMWIPRQALGEGVPSERREASAVRSGYERFFISARVNQLREFQKGLTRVKPRGWKPSRGARALVATCQAWRRNWLL
jgi:hypothetical protein